MTCTHSIRLNDGRCYFCASRVCDACIYPGCGAAGEPTASMTAYEWDGAGEDPNAPLVLCADHAEEHVANMEQQWRDYYGSVM